MRASISASLLVFYYGILFFDVAAQGLRGVPRQTRIYRLRRNAVAPTAFIYNVTEDGHHHHHSGTARRKSSSATDGRAEAKLLKKKRKQLKKLKEEVRRLNLQLGNRADSGHDRSTRTGSGFYFPEPTRAAPPSGQSEERRWRKRILSRVKAINRRLSRLELQLAPRQRKRLMQEKKVRKIMKSSSRLTTTIRPMTTQLSPATTTHSAKLYRVYSSINQSLNGEPGGICTGHKDCKPGLCCHQRSNGTQVCVLQAFEEGHDCQDSCQCAPRLHCFQPKLTDVDILPDTPQCKKATAKDVVSGVYINKKDGILPLEDEES